jgi:hypothetical protein
MSVALPLPVGSESLCELMDVGLIGDSMPDTGSISLPDGINILDTYKPTVKFSGIAWIGINILIHYREAVSNELAEMLRRNFSKDSIVVAKRTKRGVKDLDIAPFVRDVEFTFIERGAQPGADRSLMMTANISAQNPTVNAVDLESVFEKVLKPDHIEIKRIDIYGPDMLSFK